MDAYPNIEQGYIEHTVKWALALPVQIRREVIVSARHQAHLNRQAQLGRPRGDHFGNPEVWQEIARRIENDGHTPTD